ncbi:MAG: hypothetical protein L3K23_05240 [Thermoplasmata archaeon]|nr:hypothetical protein [Thermoplasmata archaeon]
MRKARSVGPQVPLPVDYRTVAAAIRRLMGQNYGVRRVSLRAIHSDASRLSLPMKLTGSDARGRPVRYFAKLIGSQDVLAEWVAQSAKNLYLQLSHREPMFGYARTAEEMARQEYESLLAIDRAGVATAKPLGYHRLDEGLWLFVAEFLSARPPGDAGEFSSGQIDELFRDLHQLHRQGVFHGDLKCDNILVGERIFLIDAGLFRDGVDAKRKEAYDLSCLLCTLLGRHPLSRILRIAGRYYSRELLQGTLEYADLIQKRQDFDFDDGQKEELRLQLSSTLHRPMIGAPGRQRVVRPANATPMPVGPTKS